MPVKERKEIDPADLKKIGREIVSGLEQMLEFEHQLCNFSRRSLILFIVLTIDLEQYSKILNILEKLEPLLENRGKAGF